MWVMGQFTDWSDGSRVTKCDPLSALTRTTQSTDRTEPLATTLPIHAPVVAATVAATVAVTVAAMHCTQHLTITTADWYVAAPAYGAHYEYRLVS